MKRICAVRLALLVLVLMLAVTGCAPGMFRPYGDRSGAETSSEVTGPEGSAPEQDGLLRLWMIDVGQGDALLIRTPEGLYVLIDSGEDKTAAADFLDKKGVKELEYAIFTHPHSDHIGGAAEIIKRFYVKNVLMPDVTHTSKTYLELVESLENDRRINVIRAERGVTFAAGQAEFEVLSPFPETEYKDLNHYSAVVRMSFGDVLFLFMGDAEAVNETELCESGSELSAALLKVGHHGSDTSTTEALLEAVSPGFAFISCGEGNSYGHPDTEVLERLEAHGAAVYRTDISGTVLAECDGKNLTVTTEKELSACVTRGLYALPASLCRGRKAA